MDHRIKNRPAHQLVGAHKPGALYSARRAPCEKPAGKGTSKGSSACLGGAGWEGDVNGLGWAGTMRGFVSAR
ncbi:MAG: hypothetical protein M3Z35_12765, partial [Nitrospirota bacterium]|nr:hypothetical protein [Nitrospirota bacterium]